MVIQNRFVLLRNLDENPTQLLELPHQKIKSKKLSSVVPDADEVSAAAGSSASRTDQVDGKNNKAPKRQTSSSTTTQVDGKNNKAPKRQTSSSTTTQEDAFTSGALKSSQERVDAGLDAGSCRNKAGINQCSTSSNTQVAPNACEKSIGVRVDHRGAAGTRNEEGTKPTAAHNGPSGALVITEVHGDTVTMMMRTDPTGAGGESSPQGSRGGNQGPPAQQEGSGGYQGGRRGVASQQSQQGGCEGPPAQGPPAQQEGCKMYQGLPVQLGGGGRVWAPQQSQQGVDNEDPSQPLELLQKNSESDKLSSVVPDADEVSAAKLPSPAVMVRNMNIRAVPTGPVGESSQQQTESAPPPSQQGVCGAPQVLNDAQQVPPSETDGRSSERTKFGSPPLQHLASAYRDGEFIPMDLENPRTFKKENGEIPEAVGFQATQRIEQTAVYTDASNDSSRGSPIFGIGVVGKTSSGKFLIKISGYGCYFYKVVSVPPSIASSRAFPTSLYIELFGFKVVLEIVDENEYPDLLIRSDSKVAVDYMDRLKRLKSLSNVEDIIKKKGKKKDMPELTALLKELEKLISKYKSNGKRLSFQWVRRVRNYVADRGSQLGRNLQTQTYPKWVWFSLDESDWTINWFLNEKEEEKFCDFSGDATEVAKEAAVELQEKLLEVDHASPIASVVHESAPREFP